MTAYNVAKHSVRTWSSRSFATPTMGVAVAAIYLFDEREKRVGTISFFPTTLGADQPPAVLSGDRIELRFLLLAQKYEDTIQMLASGKKVRVFYNDAYDAGLEYVPVS